MRAKMLYEFLDSKNKMRLISSTPFNNSDFISGLSPVKYIYDMGVDNLELVVDIDVYNAETFLYKYEVEEVDEEFAQYVLDKIDHDGESSPPFINISFHVDSQTNVVFNKYGVLSSEYERNFVFENMAAVTDALGNVTNNFPSGSSMFVYFNGIETEKDAKRRSRELVKNNFVSSGLFLTSRNRLYLQALKQNYNVINVSKIDEDIVVEIVK